VRLNSLYFLTFAQRKSKSKVKLNFGLSPDVSIQLKVSISERLSQKLKWPNGPRCVSLLFLSSEERWCLTVISMWIILTSENIGCSKRWWNSVWCDLHLMWMSQLWIVIMQRMFNVLMVGEVPLWTVWEDAEGEWTKVTPAVSVGNAVSVRYSRGRGIVMHVANVA